MQGRTSEAAVTTGNLNNGRRGIVAKTEQRRNNGDTKKTTWKAYRDSWQGTLMDLARAPGELAVVGGIFSTNPVGLGIAALGLLEICLTTKFDDAVYARFKSPVRDSGPRKAPSPPPPT
jgi:hypothetical protein